MADQLLVRERIERALDQSTRRLTLDESFPPAIVTILHLLNVAQLALTEVTLVPAPGTTPAPTQSTFTGTVALWENAATPLRFELAADGTVTCSATLAMLTFAIMGRYIAPLDPAHIRGLTTLAFSNTQLRVSSQRRELLVTAELPAGWSLLGIPGITIERPQLILMVQNDPELSDNYQARLAGSIKLPASQPGLTIDIPVALAIPIGVGDWSVGVVPPGVALPRLTDLVKLASGADLAALLPEKLVQLTDFRLASMSVQFDPGRPAWKSTDLTITSAHSWEITSKVKLQRLALALSVRPAGTGVVFSGMASGTLAIEALEVSAYIPIPLAGLMRLEATSTAPLPNLGDLAKYFDADVAAALPEHVSTLGGLVLSSVRAMVNLDSGAFTYFGIDIASAAPWELFPGHLSLSNLHFRLEANRVGKDWGITGLIAGTVTVVGIHIAAVAERTTPAGDWRFALTEPLLLPGIGSVATLVGGSDVGSRFAPNMAREIGALTVEDFQLAFSGTPQKISSLIIALDATHPWDLVPGQLALLELSIAFTITHPTEPAKRVVAGELRATFEIESVQVSLQATAPASADDGWQLAGRTGPGQSIPIGTLLADLARIFGAFDPPATLAGLVISDIEVSFNTKTRHFTFGCRGQFPIGTHAGDAVVMHVTIDVQPEGTGYRKLFGGTITVHAADLPAPLVFDLRLADAPAATTFLAAYSHTGGVQRLKLAALLRAVIAADSPVASLITLAGDLAIDLKDVLLAYRRTAAAASGAPQQGKFLFGLDLGVDLSLANLPLVGQEFPPEQRFGVENLRLLFASAAFPAAEVGELNALLPPGISALPTDTGQGALAGGAQVSAVLRLGSQGQRTLALPIAGNNVAAPAAPAAPAAAVVASDSAKWFDLQKSFGPVHFERVGFEYREQALRFLLDAALSVGGLSLALDGLTFGSRIDHFAPIFDLRGLGLAYKSGAIEIGGALLRIPATDQQPYDEYDGAAVIRTSKLALAALGSYANVAGHPSLFVYAVLDYPIGGPAFFFVTGLAAGFGYNRRVVVPPVEQVGSFPLVVAAQRAAPITGAKSPGELLKNTLASFRTSIPPSDGDIFLAAGIRFTSFKIVDSFALLLVSFGQQQRFDLLGLSTMVMPPDAGAGVTPIAEVQLALKASFIPAEGFLGVSAQLTSQSYLFSRACQLTGGFAFYAWFSGLHGGDFVLTLGGYHPAFQPPAHYPRVPRLGFNWNYSDALTIRGDAYFALTPGALMAGAHLEVNWHAGDLRAWFNAGADFLIAWKPYHYDARVYVDVGAEYTFWLFGTHHLSVHVGADLHIWGPEFAGTAHIKLSIISFDVAFGAQSRPAAQAIEWADFKRAFLPAQPGSVALQAGLLQKRSDAALDLGLVEPQQLVLATNTLVPFTEAQIGGQAVALGTLYASGAPGDEQPGPLARTANGYAPSQPAGAHALALGKPAVGPVRVQPLGGSGAQFKSSYTLSIRRGSDAAETDFVFTPITKHVPAAMWGQLDAELKPRLGGDALVPHTLAGFTIRPAAPAQGARTDPLPLTKLGHAAGITGTLQFVQYHQPPLRDGVYTIKVTQTTESIGDPAGTPRRIPTEQFDTSAQFTVAATRLTLAPGDVQALFPPEGSLGDHASVLPHIVLSASALPWMQPGAPKPANVPWLALLLFDEAEAPAVRVATLEALRDPTKLPAEFPPAAFPTGAQPTSHPAGDKLAVIDVPRDLLGTLLPAPADLALLAHVRQQLDAAGQPASAPVAVVIGSRLPRPGKRSSAHLVVVAGLFPSGTLDPGALPGSRLVRLVSLKSWSFACTASEQNLQGLLDRLKRNRGVLAAAARLPRIVQGGTQQALYHGPCVAAPAALKGTLPAHAARELVQSADPPDMSYAAAWELGRMLALQNQSVALGLYHWKRARAQLRKNVAAPAHLPIAGQPLAGGELPVAAVSWCADLMLLKGLPFNYLVPDEAMLPHESLRFFSIDRGWLDCLLDGAFSIGRVITLGKDNEAQLFAELRAAVWARVAELRRAAQPGPSARAVPAGDPVLSGVLLRSDAVAGWPGLLVQAHSAAAEPLAELRREQLSPNVLLCLFAGEVGEVSIFQKPETLHFGLDEPDDRHAALHKENTRDDGADATVGQVPWDAGTRVVQIGALASAIAGKVGVRDMHSALLARWMIEQTPQVSIARR